MTSVAVTSVPDGRLTILKALQVPTALRHKPSRSFILQRTAVHFQPGTLGNWSWGAAKLSLTAESRLQSRFGGGAEASEFNL